MLPFSASVDTDYPFHTKVIEGDDNLVDAQRTGDANSGVYLCR